MRFKSHVGSSVNFMLALYVTFGRPGARGHKLDKGLVIIRYYWVKTNNGYGKYFYAGRELDV